MDAITKPIRLSQHARQQLTRRGTTEEEVADAIRTAPWQRAEQHRLECRNALAYNATWNNRPYAIKEVRPIFVEEATEIVVVTVYVYYA